MLLESYLTIASIGQQHDQQHDCLLASNNAEQLYGCRQSSRNYNLVSHLICMIRRVCSWRFILLSHLLASLLVWLTSWLASWLATADQAFSQYDCLTKRSARYTRIDKPYIKHPIVTRSLVDLDHDLYQEE